MGPEAQRLWEERLAEGLAGLRLDPEGEGPQEGQQGNMEDWKRSTAGPIVKEEETTASASASGSKSKPQNRNKLVSEM